MMEEYFWVMQYPWYYILQEVAFQEDEDVERIEENCNINQCESGDIQWLEYTRRPKSFPLTGQDRLLRDISLNSTPFLDAFSFLFDDTLINHIVLETNSVLHQQKFVRLNKWTIFRLTIFMVFFFFKDKSSVELLGESLHGVVANVLDCDIIVNVSTPVAVLHSLLD